MHTGKPTGVAASHCITWFQTQLILTTCQIRYHSQCGIIVWGSMGAYWHLWGPMGANGRLWGPMGAYGDL